MTATPLNRREFLRNSALAGTGLLIGFRYAEAGSVELSIAPTAADFAPSGYLRIGSDSIVTIFADHVELGQGVMTALPMIVAEELDVDWANVRIERMPDDPSAWPRRIMTVGSQSVRGSWMVLRSAGAAAREMLAIAAAKEWNVDRAYVRTDKGFAIHVDSGRRISYGDLASRAVVPQTGMTYKLKDPKDFTIIGTRRARVDIPSKVNGSAQFGIDVRVPGMLIATVIRPPAFGGSVKSFDATDAKAIPGVKDVVQFESGIAVLAIDTWTALKGRKALKVVWDDGPNAAVSSADIRAQFTAMAANAGMVATNKGDADAVLKSASNTINVDYELPFAAHATMEPMNCTAHVRADGADVWAPTQAPSSFQTTAAQIAGLSPSAVKLHVTMVGGGFGRRSRPDVLRDAVLLSKLSGAPVKVMWTREDDMQHDLYRPFGIHRMSGAVGADGLPVAWTHRIVTQHALGIGDTVGGASDLPYAIPNLRVDSVTATSPVVVAPWRSVGHSQNGFVTESFLDELAAAGKKDPVELRRILLANAPRYLGVLNLAVSKSDWGKPMPAGSGRGIAVHAMTGSYVAQIAEVTVTNNVIRVNRVICAVDCGVVINPDTLAAQIEGGVIYGLTCALKNEITVAGGRIEQDNFNTYPMLRISEAPRVEVYTVPSVESPGGIGEPGVPPIAAAVANAVFAATGKRLRKLPFRLA
jgi:isoquinoline 1-oxidoreductase beta subunit